MILVLTVVALVVAILYLIAGMLFAINAGTERLVTDDDVDWYEVIMVSLFWLPLLVLGTLMFGGPVRTDDPGERDHG